jgi:tetratricopeptide (TPR) repeat protein
MDSKEKEQSLKLAEHYFRDKNYSFAKHILGKIIEIDANNSKANELLAYIYRNSGQFDISFELLNLACSQNECSPKALYYLGSAQLERGLFGEAIETFTKSILKGGEFFEALHDLATAQAHTGDLNAAINNYQKCLKFGNLSHELFFNIARIYDDLKRYEEAVTHYDKALSLKPDYAEAWSNKGVTLNDLKRYDEAIAHYDKALSLKPDYAEAYYNKGNTLNELKRFDEAIAHYDKALSLKPDYHEASWNKSLSLLLQGDFENGLPLYESRWHSEKVSEIAGKRFFEKPTWLGAESLKDKTILLYGEQGLGDFIQFCRYVKLVAGLGAKVILEVPQSLATLLTGLTGVSEFVIKGQELPPFDFCCPIVSLPLAFNTRVSSIPAENRYIASDVKKVSEWRFKLGEKKKKRVGLVWSSLSNFQHDAKRSLLLSDFVKALPVDGYEYVCLQKELKDCDKEFFKEYQNIQFFGDQLNDFSDTAALIESVDLVVSTCTSVPHLSAAMGKETWVLLSHVPDWRWLLDREDSPWYPSMKLYRQTSIGNWNSVLDKVKSDLSSN